MSSALKPHVFRAKSSGNVHAIVEVSAMRWDGSYASQSSIVTWGYPAVSGWFDGSYYLRVDGQNGHEFRAERGDWVIQSGGEFAVVDSATFEATFEPTAETS